MHSDQLEVCSLALFSLLTLWREKREMMQYFMQPKSVPFLQKLCCTTLLSGSQITSQFDCVTVCVVVYVGGGYRQEKHERGGSGLNSNLSVCYVHSGGMKSVERQNWVSQQLLTVSFATIFFPSAHSQLSVSEQFTAIRDVQYHHFFSSSPSFVLQLLSCQYWKNSIYVLQHKLHSTLNVWKDNKKLHVLKRNNISQG